MGMRDSLEDLLVAIGGVRQGKSSDELVENIAIMLNPLVEVYVKPCPEFTGIKVNNIPITDYQHGIKVIGDEIHGTVKYLTDGNYLVLDMGIDIEPTQEPSLKFAYKLNTDNDWTSSTFSVDGKRYYVNEVRAKLHITDCKHQKLMVRAEMNGFPAFERVYHLNNLKCLKG